MYFLGIVGILGFCYFVIFFLIVTILRYFNLVLCIFNNSGKILSHPWM